MMTRILLGLSIMLLSLSLAQSSDFLIGTWQAQSGDGVTLSLTMNHDGSYSYEDSLGNYEQGLWSYSGATYIQTWQDPETGQSESATYTLIPNSETLFILSGGNLGIGTLAFYRIVDAAGQSVDTTWIIGDWISPEQGLEFGFSADGTYTFAIPTTNHFEQGSWQLAGSQLTQSWIKSDTQEARRETYTVKQVLESSFVISGGNLESSVFVFQTKESLQPVTLQIAAPATGSYNCTTVTTSLTMTSMPTATGTVSIPMSIPTFTPSFLSPLTLDGLNYTTSLGSGTYSYHADTNQVHFLGAPLENLLGQYSFNGTVYSFIFSYTQDGETQQHTCTLLVN